jgi:hypothetical protein
VLLEQQSQEVFVIILPQSILLDKSANIPRLLFIELTGVSQLKRRIENQHYLLQIQKPIGALRLH